MILRQTGVMFVDAYRELNYKKLFWITMALSIIVVAVLACLGITDEGPTIFGWQMPFEIISTRVIEKATFYKLLFFLVGFSIWLTWAATILAIISTSSIIPDFVSSGSIELSLSKPIGRLRLFLTKYLTGLTFVALQVAVFSLATFLVIGVRGSSWDPRVFWAIPLIVLFFSYLFAVSALAGLVTRSAVAAIIATALVWVAAWAVNSVEAGLLLQSRMEREMAVSLHETEITKLQKDLATLPQTGGTEQQENERKRLSGILAEYEAGLAKVNESLATVKMWHSWTYGVAAILPKTGATIEVLRTQLVRGSEIEKLVDNAPEPPPRMVNRLGAVRVSQKTLAKEHSKAVAGRSLGWVIGTSLAFEGVLLGAAALLFCRRDF